MHWRVCIVGGSTACQMTGIRKFKTPISSTNKARLAPTQAQQQALKTCGGKAFHLQVRALWEGCGGGAGAS